MRFLIRWGIAGLSLFLCTQIALAEDVIDDSGKAKVNWTTQEMIFTGDGAPNLNAPNAASARLGAERAAKLDALRKALESIKGIKIKAGETVGQKMEAKDGIRSSIEGVIRGFIEKEVRYYSDGGVQRDLVIPIKGEVTKVIMEDEVPAAPKAPAKTPEPVKKAEPVAPAAKNTGLVVVAKGFKVIPVLAPKIIDEDGKDVYDVTMVTEGNFDNGIASYQKDLEKAKTDKKVAAIPMVVNALKSPNSVDLIVSNADAAKIRQVAKAQPFLSQGRVIIVKD